MNGPRDSLEKRLAATDFSDASAIRDELRRDLLLRVARDHRGAGPARPPRGRFAMFRRPVPAFGLGVLAAALALTLALPEGRAALARLPGLLRIGEHTAIVTERRFSDVQLDSLVGAFNVQQERGQVVSLDTPYGGFGAAVPEGGDPYIKEVCSLSVAAGLVDHPLLVPTYYNERIPATMRFQKAMILPDGMTVLYFGFGSLETVLELVPLSESTLVSSSECTATVGPDGKLVTTLVQPVIEEMAVGGRKVVWQVHSEGSRHNLGGLAVKKTDVEIGRFRWEQDGLSCVLDGKFLTKEEGIRILESLKVYGR